MIKRWWVFNLPLFFELKNYYSYFMVKTILLLICAVIVFAFWEKNELKKFKITHYSLNNNKIKNELCIALISDLHGFSYGDSNSDLLKEIINGNPDFILISGDMVTYERDFDFEAVSSFINRLTEKYTVFYTNGNHESRYESLDSFNKHSYERFLSIIKSENLIRLNNDSFFYNCKGNRLKISGLELERIFYKRFSGFKLNVYDISNKIGFPDNDSYNILIAHSPAFTKEYINWGADLCVSGHDHGGLIRFPKIGSIVSPQFKLFPKFDGGLYEFGNKAGIVSRGLGTHRYNIRINNRAELIFIHLSNH